MKNIALALLMTAVSTFAAVPPIVYRVDSVEQQNQPLPNQDFVQGASVSLRYYILTSGKYWDLSGLSAKWDARESETSTNAYQATGTAVTNVTPNYFAINLTESQTGTAISNWIYRLTVVSGGKDTPMGKGRIDIATSTWTGASAILSTVTSASYTDAAVSNHAAIVASSNTLGHVKVGAGLSIDAEGVLTSSAGAPAWGDVTDKPTTFPPYLANTQATIRAATSAGVGIWSMSDGEVVTFGAGNTANAAFLGGLSVAGNLTTGGTNLLTLIETKVPTNDAPYAAALTNIVGTGGIAISGSGRNRVIDGGGLVATNNPRHLAAITNEVDPTATNLLDLAGTRPMTGTLQMDENLVYGKRFGKDAGAFSTGSEWFAGGRASGNGCSGDEWTALGYGTGNGTIGDKWSAAGHRTGEESIHTNSHSFGGYSGRGARGDNRLYVDVYDGPPSYSADGATNDMIFGDNGFLRLGRGGGAPAGKQGGMLRGTWNVDMIGGNFTNMTAQPASTQIGNVTNLTIAASGGLYQRYGFTATNALAIVLTGPGAGNSGTVEATFTNWTSRAVSWQTSGVRWANTAPTGSYAQAVLRWDGTNVTAINTTYNGQ